MHSAKNSKDTNVRQSVQQLDSRQSDGWADGGGGQMTKTDPKSLLTFDQGTDAGHSLIVPNILVLS